MRDLLPRDQVFDLLEENGVSKVVVHFHGSHDESMIEEIAYYNAEGELDLALDLPDEDIEEDLEEVVWEEMGVGFGDSIDGVAGQATWEVSTRTVEFSAAWLEWTEDKEWKMGEDDAP